MNSIKSLNSGKYTLVSLFSLAFAFSACGEAPSFREQKSQHATNGTLDSSSEDQVEGDPSDADKAVDDKDENTVDDKDDGKNGGKDDGKDDTANGGHGGNNGGDNDNNNGSPKPDEILVEDGGTLNIPGVKVQKVGVNFEDYNDADYNDAVLCFTGNFKVENSEVVSYQNQTIAAKSFSASACDHRIDVKIIHADGTSDSLSYSSDTKETIKLPFKIKSRLEVTMTVLNGVCALGTTSMHDAKAAIVKPNVCNTSGN